MRERERERERVGNRWIMWLNRSVITLNATISFLIYNNID